MQKFRVVAGVAAAVLLVVGLAIGGWQLGWWAKEASVNKNAEILQDSYGRQNALVEQILDDIREVDTPGISDGQKISVTSQICDSAGKLTGSIQLPLTAASFISEEC